MSKTYSKSQEELFDSFFHFKWGVNMYNTNSKRIYFFNKRLVFGNFLFFFPKRGPFDVKIVKIDFPFFKNFKNTIEKWLLWDHSNMNRNKVMNFGGHCSYPVETVYGHPGHNSPPLLWIGLIEPVLTVSPFCLHSIMY